MKRKDSDCVGILSDKGEAATASNLSEYTISNKYDDDNDDAANPAPADVKALGVRDLWGFFYKFHVYSIRMNHVCIM